MNDVGEVKEIIDIQEETKTKKLVPNMDKNEFYYIDDKVWSKEKLEKEIENLCENSFIEIKLTRDDDKISLDTRVIFYYAEYEMSYFVEESDRSVPYLKENFDKVINLGRGYGYYTENKNTADRSLVVREMIYTMLKQELKEKEKLQKEITKHTKIINQLDNYLETQ